MASDPVELAAETRVKAWHPHGDESFEAYRRRQITAQLAALRKDGWRIVRLRPERVYERTIADEWTPEEPS